MSTELPGGYTARRPTLDDAEALAELINTCTRADLGISIVSPEQMQGLAQLPGHDFDQDDWLVLAPDGSLAACGTLFSLEPFNDIQVVAVVHPAHEGRGIGSWLVAATEARGEHYVARASADTDVLLRTQSWSNNSRAERLLTEHGYHLERVFRLMQIDFTPETVLPDVHVPHGITIRTFVRHQDEELAWLGEQESFRDHWNHHEIPFETWVQLSIESVDSFDPSVWWLALEGDEVAGVALCLADAPGEPEFGLVSTLGVRRPWRGRGVAMALLRTAFAAFQARGKAGVWLGVDADSPTGAYRLYERAGMHVVTDTITYSKVLRPATKLS